MEGKANLLRIIRLTSHIVSNTNRTGKSILIVINHSSSLDWTIGELLIINIEYASITQ